MLIEQLRSNQKKHTPDRTANKCLKETHDPCAPLFPVWKFAKVIQIHIQTSFKLIKIIMRENRKWGCISTQIQTLFILKVLSIPKFAKGIQIHIQTSFKLIK